MALQRIAGGRGRGFAPYGIDQLVDADEIAVLQRQGCQHGLASQAVIGPGLAIDDHVDRQSGRTCMSWSPWH